MYIVPVHVISFYTYSIQSINYNAYKAKKIYVSLLSPDRP